MAITKKRFLAERQIKGSPSGRLIAQAFPPTRAAQPSSREEADEIVRTWMCSAAARTLSLGRARVHHACRRAHYAQAAAVSGSVRGSTSVPIGAGCRTEKSGSTNTSVGAMQLYQFHG
jgi:Tfp pilus assembly protein PilV